MVEGKQIKKAQQINNNNIRTFEKFLQAHKATDTDVVTHTLFGPPWGKYSIKDEETDEFNSLYADLVGHYKMYVIERPKKVGPILIDIDFKFDADHAVRQYTDKDVTMIVTKMNNIIKKYYKCTKTMLLSYIFEKKLPTHNKKTNEYKDGFHIVYPNVAFDTEMRYVIMNELYESVKEEKSFSKLKAKNSLDDIIDMSVVERNGWCMYGSRKYECQPYSLTSVLTYNLQKYQSNLTDEEYVKLFSNRKYSDNDVINVKDNVDKADLNKRLKQIRTQTNPKKTKSLITDFINAEDVVEIDDNFEQYAFGDSKVDSKVDSKIDSKVNNNKDNKKEPELKDDALMASHLVKIMSVARATSYDSWIRVGWALKATSNLLLDSFKIFSRKAKNYDPKACEKVWLSTNTYGQTIKSLKYWAQKDDPVRYTKVVRSSINTLFEDAETGTENDIAKLMHKMWSHTYCCASLKYNIWFEFKNHRWREIQKGYTLDAKMSNELSTEFLTLNSWYMAKAAAAQGLSRDSFMQKSNNIMKITTKLKTTGFKDKVLTECSKLFFDPEFEEKLDANKDLICFENGVYDLTANSFREGTPDDHITFTTGYNYVKYTDLSKEVVEIQEFFNKIQLEEDMREYILTLLASYLDGHNKNQKFVIWTGSGANGKSTCVELFQLSIGDYGGVLPITVLTKKRGAAGAATPEMAMTKGKRFVVFQEPEGDDQIYVGYMKELTGGDMIYARPLFRDPIRFKPQFKLLLTCNKLPFIPSTDGGTWRRLRVSPWETEFVDVDKKGRYKGKELKKNQFPKDYDLGDKFENWKSVFMWLLLTKYYPLYKKAGLKEPKKVTQFTKKYEKTSDIYLEFIEESLIVSNDVKKDSLTIMEVYNLFKTWYKDSYTNKCPPKKELIEYFNSKEFTVKQNRIYGIKYAFDENHEEDHNI